MECDWQGQFVWCCVKHFFIKKWSVYYRSIKPTLHVIEQGFVVLSFDSDRKLLKYITVYRYMFLYGNKKLLSWKYILNMFLVSFKYRTHTDQLEVGCSMSCRLSHGKYKDYIYGNVSTAVLEKIKKIIEDKAKKWYDVSRHMQLHMSKYKKMKIHYPLCQTYSPTVV